MSEPLLFPNNASVALWVNLSTLLEYLQDEVGLLGA